MFNWKAENEKKKEFVTVGEGDGQHVIPVDYMKEKKENDKFSQFYKKGYKATTFFKNGFGKKDVGYKLYKGDINAFALDEGDIELTKDEYIDFEEKRKKEENEKDYKILKFKDNSGREYYEVKKENKVLARDYDIFKIKKYISDMEDKKIKEYWDKKAQNQILLDENVSGKGRHFSTRFLEPGLVKYSFGVCLLEKETIDRFIYNFVGCPVIINHKDVTNESAKDDRVGVISRVWFNETDGWYWGEGVIFEQEALDLIDKGYNVSCQYEICEYSSTGGIHNGNEYDKVILNGKPEHLAIVQNPRYENAMIAVNAMEIEEKEETQIEENKEDEIGKNVIIQAINDIKEIDMFKNLFKKKEKNMDKDEIKSIFMECLTELTASNEAEKKEEVKEEVKEEKEEEKEVAENKCKNEEPDYKKMYEDLKAKCEAKEEKEKAKNAIDEQKELLNSGKVETKIDYITEKRAKELGKELF